MNGKTNQNPQHTGIRTAQRSLARTRSVGSGERESGASYRPLRRVASTLSPVIKPIPIPPFPSYSSFPPHSLRDGANPIPIHPLCCSSFDRLFILFFLFFFHPLLPPIRPRTLRLPPPISPILIPSPPSSSIPNFLHSPSSVPLILFHQPQSSAIKPVHSWVLPISIPWQHGAEPRVSTPGVRVHSVPWLNVRTDMYMVNIQNEAATHK